MGKKLPMIYELTLLDSDGSEVNYGDRVLRLLSPDVEREVQFREIAENAGALKYDVHLMMPKEVKQRIREENGPLLDRYVKFVAETIGLEEVLASLPVIAGYQRTSNSTA